MIHPWSSQISRKIYVNEFHEVARLSLWSISSRSDHVCIHWKPHYQSFANCGPTMTSRQHFLQQYQYNICCEYQTNLIRFGKWHHPVEIKGTLHFVVSETLNEGCLDEWKNELDWRTGAAMCCMCQIWYNEESLELRRLGYIHPYLGFDSWDFRMREFRKRLRNKNNPLGEIFLIVNKIFKIQNLLISVSWVKSLEFVLEFSSVVETRNSRKHQIRNGLNTRNVACWFCGLKECERAMQSPFS